MGLISSSCFGGAALHTLNLAPAICRAPSLLKTLALNPHHRVLGRPQLSSIFRASLATREEKVAVKPQWRTAIDFKWIRENKDAVADNIRNRNSNANLDLVLKLYEKFLNLQKEVEWLRAERNVVANKMKGKLESSVRQALVEEGKSLKEGLVALEEDLVQVTDQLQQEAQCIPNMTHPDVPIGGEESSVIKKMVSSPRKFNFALKDHLELGKDLDLFDFDAAAEVSGSKFYYLKNEAVLLEMGLINWAIAEVSKRGFTPLITPEVVRSTVIEKCGFQPRGLNTQVYSIEGSDQCLIGTAEIPVGGIHMDSILRESDLPLKYVAYSHCFRTEAGAAGTATRGLYRVHQFSKVEMFIFCRPEESNLYHEELIAIEEDLFTSLSLHFKILDMATGDLGAPACRKFDVEAWMPGLGRFGEISSASNCTDYQSRRLGIRYRPFSSDSSAPTSRKGKGADLTPTRFVHTLNATACAVPRMIICLLENFQQEDGSVVIPEPLRPFMGGLNVISPKEVEWLRAERNVVANKMKGKLESSVRQALVEEGKSLKEGLVALEEDLVQVTDQLQQEAQCIPNMTHPDVPIGGEESSVIKKMVSSPRKFNFALKDHLELGKDLDLFDFDAAAEVSGSKFYYLKNEAVLLEMGLINWAIAEVSKRGFTPLITPEVVRSTVIEKCGFQPRGLNTQVYSIEGSDQCLIGTAEIPVGGIHMDSILRESDLPLKYVAYSHCFRTEAGAAGTATRGLYRVHQFSKVEMFIFCRPEESNLYHEELIAIEEDLFTSLSLHFKILDMATGDLGAPACRKFDVEAWMPGLGRFGEISSASNCTDYQSRRLGIRYRPFSSDSSAPTSRKGKGADLTPTRFVHTLNATACAVPRMIICLLENFQQEDGSVVIPEPLRPFMGGLNVISPKVKG